MTDTLEGLLKVDGEGLAFQPCNSADVAWVFEAPGADLREAAKELIGGGKHPIRARVVGESVMPPDEGAGAGYPDAIRVVQWVYLAEDTVGCAEVGGGIFGNAGP
ncbi:MAG: hypothetical protein P8125_13115 [Gemmatimonadota bacterium]